MAEMRNFEQEALDAARRAGHRLEGLFHHAAEAATETPAQQPVNLAATPVAAATPQEEPMFTIADLEADAKTFVAKFEQIDKTALAKLDAATSNPETDDVLSDIAKLAGLPIPAGAIAGVANGLKTLLGLYAPEPEPVAAQQAPAPAQ